MAAVADLLYRMGIEGDEQVKAAFAAMGAEEQAAAERAVNTYKYRESRHDQLTKQVAAGEADMAAARAKALAAITGTMPAYEANMRAVRQQSDAERQANVVRNQSIASIGQMRAGSQQMSFQIQDVTQQIALGVNPMVIFAQQGGQVVQAIDMMSGGKSRLLSLLAGPWGAVFMGATMIVGMLVQELWKSEEATKRAEAGASGLSAAQGALGDVFDLTSGKIKSQNELLILNARLMAANLRAEALAADASSRAAFGEAGTRNGTLSAMGAGPFALFEGAGQPGNRGVRALARQARAASRMPEGAERTAMFDQILRSSEDVDFSGSGIDRGGFQQAVIDYASSQAKRQVADAIDRSLDSGRLADELRRPDTGKPRRASDAADREATRQAKEYADMLRQLEDRYDPLSAAARKYREELDRIDVAAKRPLKQGGIDGATAAKWREGAERTYRNEEFRLTGMNDVATNATRIMDRYRQSEAQGEARRSRALADQQSAVALAERELQLVGANDNLRDAEMRKLRLILGIKRDFPDATEAWIKKMVEAEMELIGIENRTVELAASYRELHGIGDEFVSRVLDPQNWRNWGDAGKSILNELMQDVWRLAAVNPIKNWLFDAGLPTFGSVFDAAFGKNSPATIAAGAHMAPGNSAGTYDFPGGLARVGENGPETVYLQPRSQIMRASLSRQRDAAGPSQGGGSVHFHLKGAVVTQDLLDQMNAIGEAAAVQGAAAGSRMAQSEFIDRQQRRLGRPW